MVMTAFRLDFEDGGDRVGAVQVAICARLRTVSSGKRIDRSRAEAANVATDQEEGFIFGSIRR